MLACATCGSTPLLRGCFASTSCVVAQPCRLRACDGRSVIGTEPLFVARQQRPHDPGIFVRERHSTDILIPSVEQLVEPTGRWFIFGEPNHCPSSVNQKR